MDSTAPNIDEEWGVQHATALIESYAKWTGKALVSDLPRSKSDWFATLFNADFALASHGTEPSPIFNFGNRIALELFDLTWESLTKLPSKESAEPVHRSEREELLRRVTENGFIDDYQGIRISSNGQRFRIHQATAWNLLDEKGAPYGQAACFSAWTWLESACQ